MTYGHSYTSIYRFMVRFVSHAHVLKMLSLAVTWMPSSNSCGAQRVLDLDKSLSHILYFYQES